MKAIERSSSETKFYNERDKEKFLKDNLKIMKQDQPIKKRVKAYQKYRGPIMNDSHHHHINYNNTNSNSSDTFTYLTTFKNILRSFFNIRKAFLRQISNYLQQVIQLY